MMRRGEGNLRRRPQDRPVATIGASVRNAGNQGKRTRREPTSRTPFYESSIESVARGSYAHWLELGSDF